METNVNQGNSLFTVKKVLRVLELLLIVFVFCPSFLVSCSGQTVNVSVMTAVGGAKAYGETVADPHPIMLICLVLPIVMLVAIFSKKMIENKVAIITLASAAIDFVVWLIFRFSVKNFAENNYCEFKTTAVYVFNIIVLILIILLAVMVVIKKMSLENDLIQFFTGGGTQNAINQMTNAVKQMSSAVSQMAGNVVNNINEKNTKTPVIGYCQKCGSGIPFDCRFCTSCGTPVPETMILEAEAKRKEEENKIEVSEHSGEVDGTDSLVEQSIFCSQCGSKIPADSTFCVECGAKVE